MIFPARNLRRVVPQVLQHGMPARLHCATWRSHSADTPNVGICLTASEEPYVCWFTQPASSKCIWVVWNLCTPNPMVKHHFRKQMRKNWRYCIPNVYPMSRHIHLFHHIPPQTQQLGGPVGAQDLWLPQHHLQNLDLHDGLGLGPWASKQCQLMASVPPTLIDIDMSWYIHNLFPYHPQNLRGFSTIIQKFHVSFHIPYFHVHIFSISW